MTPLLVSYVGMITLDVGGEHHQKIYVNFLTIGRLIFTMKWVSPRNGKKFHFGISVETDLDYWVKIANVMLLRGAV